LKDLSDDITAELSKRLQADGAALEKCYQFFGLKMGGGYPLKAIKQMFPDTAVSVFKECFEALRLYDLVEIMAKVKPRSLRPAVSLEQIEKLRIPDDRPTKYHSNVAVLIVNHIVKEDIVGREDAEKIETFFKDLNSQNEVATIALASTQKTNEVSREMKKINNVLRYHHLSEDRCKKDLESLLQQKAGLEKELEEAKMEKARLQRRSLERELKGLKEQELWCRGNLEDVAKKKEQAERDFEKLKELEKENTKPLSTAIEKWIHNQGLLTPYTYTHVYSNQLDRGVLI